MASMVICHCCGMGEDHHDKAMGASSWPPQMPPVVEDSQGHTFIRGYLKRLNSQKPGAESEEKWVVRWIELERPLDRPGSSELLLSVYKSDAKLKRLNAVIFRRIKASVLSRVRAARVYNVSSRKVGGSRVPHMLPPPSQPSPRARATSRACPPRAPRAPQSVDFDLDDPLVICIRVQNTVYRLMARDRADTETWVTTLKQQLELANSREPAAESL